MRRLLCCLAAAAVGWAAAGAKTVAFAAAQEGGGYLAAYQDAAAPQASVSGWSMVAYLFSLLVVFAFVAALAYVVSRFIGSRFAPRRSGRTGKVLERLPLGSNRSVEVVEIAGKVMLLGVTEQSIVLLEEVTDELEIARLRSAAETDAAGDDFQQVFEKQLLSLNRLSKKIPTLLERKDRR